MFWVNSFTNLKLAAFNSLNPSESKKAPSPMIPGESWVPLKLSRFRSRPRQSELGNGTCHFLDSRWLSKENLGFSVAVFDSHRVRIWFVEQCWILSLYSHYHLQGLQFSSSLARWSIPPNTNGQYHSVMGFPMGKKRDVQAISPDACLFWGDPQYRPIGLKIPLIGWG